MKTFQYLDALKKALQLPTDYALAKHLDIATATMSNYRNGHRSFDNTMAAQVAEILDIEPMKVIADMEIERGSNDEIWKRIARKVATVAVVAIGAGVSAPPSAHAAQNCIPAVQNGIVAAQTDRLCIMLSFIAWLLAALGLAPLEDQLPA